MGNGPNGNDRHHDVPILGQPFKFERWFSTVVITCQCAAKRPVLLIGQNVAACDGCQRKYRVEGIQWDLKKGTFSAQIGLVLGIAEDQKALTGAAAGAKE